MKLFKNKLIMSLLSCAAVLVLALGITFACLDFSPKNDADADATSVTFTVYMESFDNRGTYMRSTTALSGIKATYRYSTSSSGANATATAYATINSSGAVINLNHDSFPFGDLVFEITPQEGYVFNSSKSSVPSPNYMNGYKLTSTTGTIYLDIDSSSDVWKWTSHTAPLSVGNGTSSSPYEISTPEQLAFVAYRINNLGDSANGIYFKQTADIDLSAYEWVPIYKDGTTSGSSTSYGNGFQGNYDGQNYKISGLIINNPDTNNQGLFGLGYHPTLKNIHLVGAKINGAGGVGGIIGNDVGNGSWGYITNCSIDETSTITGTGNNVGGIAGNVGSYINVSKCFNKASVTGSSYVGGIAGNNGTGYVYITNCVNAGKISTSNSSATNIGGISGGTPSIHYGKVSKCINAGEVKGTGLFGGTLSTSVSGGALCPYDSVNISANLPLNGPSGTYQNSFKYYFGGRLQEPYSVSTYGSVTDGLLQLARDRAWYLNSSNWTEVWTEDELWFLDELDSWYYWREGKFTGAGTQSDPYIIDSSERLALLAYNVNELGEKYENMFFKQTADINLGDFDWIPIGVSTSGHYFYGNYDGDNYKISSVHAVYDRFMGIFGRVEGSENTFKNIHIRDSLFTDSDSRFVGSIIAYPQSAQLIVENCSSNAVLLGNSRVGGLIGCIRSGRALISDCYFDGSISGNIYIAGGIVGDCVDNSDEVFINNCQNLGDISSTSDGGYIGGVVGGVAYGAIQNCISKGTLSSKAALGSIAGASAVKITNCAGFGYLFGDQNVIEFCGGIVGYTIGSVIECCSFNGGSNLNIGFIYGSDVDNTATVSDCYAKINSRKGYTQGTFEGFTVVENMNDGLPMQNELYHITAGESAVTPLARLQSKGFTLFA